MRMSEAIDDFDAAWMALAVVGRVDSRGGAEYRRVLGEYLDHLRNGSTLTSCSWLLQWIEHATRCASARKPPAEEERVGELGTFHPDGELESDR